VPPATNAGDRSLDHKIPTGGLGSVVSVRHEQELTLAQRRDGVGGVAIGLE
jgi:hypothetical protein